MTNRSRTIAPQTAVPGQVEGALAASAAPPPLYNKPKRRMSMWAKSAAAVTIGRALQAHYDDVVNAPLPDRLLVLLAELEAMEKNRG